MDIFINFKNYSSGIGEKQVELLDFLESLHFSSYPSSSLSLRAEGLSPKIYNLHLVVPSTEISPIWQKYSFNLWAEHADPVEEEQKTGWISPLMIKEAGARGVMLNHCEHRLPQSVLEKTVEICRRQNLKVMICCQTEKEAINYSKLNPDFLAFEPPELIASKTKSVISKEKEIKKLISTLSPITYPIKPTPLIIGAGIHNRADIKKSAELGAAGVLISSAIMQGNKNDIRKLLSIDN